MKSYGFEQRSLEWYSVRAGVVTASEIDALVSPLFSPRDGKGVATYLAQKLAEKWTGGGLPEYVSDEMEYGMQMEESARKFYEKKCGQEILKVGFISSDDGTIGCSPDGIIGGDEGLEIKCPSAKTHVGYLLADCVPLEYRTQVQFGLYVTGFDSWTFVSYRPGFPALIKKVSPDEKAFAAFDKALAPFLASLNDSYKLLCEKNGGEPDRNLFREQVIAVPTVEIDLNELNETIP